MSKQYTEYETNIINLINKIKKACKNVGLSGNANEQTIMSTVFLYKFLNDKFEYNINVFADEMNTTKEEIYKNNNNYLTAFYLKHSNDVVMKYEDTISYLIQFNNQSNFAKIFDETLTRISNYENNYKFGFKHGNGTREPIFKEISINITDNEKRNQCIKEIFSYLCEEKFDFSHIFSQQSAFDFYSTIFETLISDYNKDEGSKGEYYTPQNIARIISKILVSLSPLPEQLTYDIYDPSAGTGSLILHLAYELGKNPDGTNKANIFTQDQSEKSSNFLRINMLLNSLTESLDNIIQDDTLLKPAHRELNNENELKHFDLISANPPFNADFADTREELESVWKNTKRFFAGLPNSPKPPKVSNPDTEKKYQKSKDKMMIYLPFIQHILFSLKENGRAAIVVPTGFLTGDSPEIKSIIRKHLVDEEILSGIISMPGKLFANTETNVSILLIDKNRKIQEKKDPIILIDASHLGHKVKIDDNLRTVLSLEEEELIINTFINKEEIAEFSILVSKQEILEKNYSFNPGQYFPIKIESINISQEEYDKMIEDFNNDFATYVEETLLFQTSIKEQLEGLIINE